MLKTRLILTLVMTSLLFVSCGGIPPKMPRKIKVWNGAPERAAICRLSNSELSDRSTIPFHYINKVAKERARVNGEVDCIPATDDRFRSYAALTFDDLALLYEYTETLLQRCEKWEKGDSYQGKTDPDDMKLDDLKKLF